MPRSEYQRDREGPVRSSIGVDSTTPTALRDERCCNDCSAYVLRIELLVLWLVSTHKMCPCDATGIGVPSMISWDSLRSVGDIRNWESMSYLIDIESHLLRLSLEL